MSGTSGMGSGRGMGGGGVMFGRGRMNVGMNQRMAGSIINEQAWGMSEQTGMSNVCGVNNGNGDADDCTITMVETYEQGPRMSETVTEPSRMPESVSDDRPSLGSDSDKRQVELNQGLLSVSLQTTATVSRSEEEITVLDSTGEESKQRADGQEDTTIMLSDSGPKEQCGAGGSQAAQTTASAHNMQTFSGVGGDPSTTITQQQAKTNTEQASFQMQQNTSSQEKNRPMEVSRPIEEGESELSPANNAACTVSAVSENDDNVPGAGSVEGRKGMKKSSTNYCQASPVHC